MSEPVQPQATEEQLQRSFTGRLSGNVVAVDDPDSSELTRRGFGEKETVTGTGTGTGTVHLRIYEAMYLVRMGLLTVLDQAGGTLAFEGLADRSLKEDKRGWTKFLLYRDLRSRGYVVREGYGIRSDLRVYDRGEYGKSAAKFVVLPLNEGEKTSLSSLKRMTETIYRMGKEPLVGVVERRGEIIYYRASKMVFQT
ncbi:MAG: tRNA-intron lyase [Nitrososphaerota archaeon]|nr:tRNA-intron lyase [Nitrososphaerota archaeon]MDG6939328.1 tRNA-intron lyase [Nitrososphaerota archaeon]